MSYGKVKDTFWTDKKILALPDDAKLLALYFLTGPHRNILGCMRVPDGYIMADLKWPSERLSDAIRTLCACQFICRDDDGWTLIRNQLKHDPLSVPNHVKAAITIANTVPRESYVFQQLVPILKTNLEAIGKASEWHVDDIAIPEPLPEPEPIHDEIRAKPPLIAPEAQELAVAFLEAIGQSDPLDITPEFAGTLMRADAWHRAGWPREMIVSEARRVMEGRPAPPGMKYFEKVFANKFASLNAPAPEGKPTDRANGKAGNVIAAADRLIERVRQFDQPAPAEGDLRLGAGASVIRAIPER